jgi:uncharacterized protein (TIGR01244 family)
MLKRIQITDKLSIGPQPEREEFEELKEEGFRSVINLRVDGEDQEMVSPIDEGDLVAAQEMTYLHHPISTRQISPGQVDDFRQFVETLDDPVFVHCKAGTRAAVLAMMHKAVEENWSGARALDEAGKMGIKCDNEQLASFVKQYVDQHKEEKAGAAKPAHGPYHDDG